MMKKNDDDDGSITGVGDEDEQEYKPNKEDNIRHDKKLNEKNYKSWITKQF